MMVHLKDPINLAHLLNGQLHRIPPEKLEQTVKDYDLLAAIFNDFSNGLVDFETIDQLINNIQEKVFQVKEYTRSDGSNKATYTHDEQTLDVFKPIIIDASQKLFANIFPASDISNWHDEEFDEEFDVEKEFNKKLEKLNPLIKNIYLNKSDEVLSNDIEARYNKTAQNTYDERIKKYVFMGEQAATLFFFANKRHLPFVQVNNPYSIEKYNKEYAKDLYDIAELNMVSLVSEIERLYQQPNVDSEAIIKNLTEIHLFITDEHEDFLSAFIEYKMFNILKSTINLKKISDENDKRSIQQILKEIEKAIDQDGKSQ